MRSAKSRSRAEIRELRRKIEILRREEIPENQQ